MNCLLRVIIAVTLTASAAIGAEPAAATASDGAATAAVTDGSVTTSVSVAKVSAALIEAAVNSRSNFSGTGDVTVLGDGTVLLKVGGDLARDASGKLYVVPSFSVAWLGTGTDNEESLRAMSSHDDVNFSVTWRDDGGVTIAIATVDDEGNEGVLEINSPNDLADPAEPQPGPSCSVPAGTCSESSSGCTQTCPPGKACIAYCNGAVAECDCVSIPRDPASVHDGATTEVMQE